MTTVWLAGVGGSPTGMTVGLPFTVSVTEALTTVPADPDVITRATPWPLEQTPGVTVGSVRAPVFTVAETVKATLLAGGVDVQVVVPLVTQTDIGTAGTATGPTVPDTVIGAAMAVPAMAMTPTAPDSAARARTRILRLDLIIKFLLFVGLFAAGRDGLVVTAEMQLRSYAAAAR